MKNFIQAGNVVTLPAPTGGVLSGGGMLVGSIFGVAAYDAAQGADVECALTGIFELPKATGAITVGAKVYWDNTAKNVTTTSSGNSLIGVAARPATSDDATVQVRLNGTSV